MAYRNHAVSTVSVGVFAGFVEAWTDSLHWGHVLPTGVIFAGAWMTVNDLGDRWRAQRSARRSAAVRK